MKCTVAQIVRVRLAPGAKDSLTASAYERAEEWLKHWTPRANFQAVIAPSLADAVMELTEDLRKTLVPSWLSREAKVLASHFQFEISEQEVVDGRFWMPSCTVWCQWHDIPEEIK